MNTSQNDGYGIKYWLVSLPVCIAIALILFIVFVYPLHLYIQNKDAIIPALFGWIYWVQMFFESAFA